MRWSAEQDEALRECASQGVEACTRLLARRFGVRRTPEAVQRHGQRIGVTFRRYEICPRCGGKTTQIKRSGLCPACHMRELAAQAREKRKEIERDAKDNESGETYAAARREWRRARQAELRDRKRDCGDYVDLSAQMSTTWSEYQASQNSHEKIGGNGD